MTNTTTIQPGEQGADYVRLTDPIKLALLARGHTFVARYAVPPETTSIGKVITAAEIEWLHANRIGIVLVWEINALDGYRGAPAGRYAGEWSKNNARQLGCPESVPLFCAIDTDTTTANVTKFRAYVNAFAAAIAPHPLGLYGDTDIALAMADHRPVFWRAGARSWSRADYDAHIVQSPGAVPPGIDLNICRLPFTAWLPALDQPPTQPGDDPMPEFARVATDDTAVLIVDKLTCRHLADADEVAAARLVCSNTPDTARILEPHELRALAFLGQQPHYHSASSAGDTRCRADMFGQTI